MKEAKVPCEFYYYDGAGHAFMNEGKTADEKRNGILYLLNIYLNYICVLKKWALFSHQQVLETKHGNESLNFWILT